MPGHNRLHKKDPTLPNIITTGPVTAVTNARPHCNPSGEPLTVILHTHTNTNNAYTSTRKFELQIKTADFYYYYLFLIKQSVKHIIHLISKKIFKPNQTQLHFSRFLYSEIFNGILTIETQNQFHSSVCCHTA